jgi:hypothetical protein
MIYNVLACFLLVDVPPLTDTLIDRFKRESSKSPYMTSSLERINPHSPFAKVPDAKEHRSPYAAKKIADKSLSNSSAPTFGGRVVKDTSTPSKVGKLLTQKTPTKEASKLAP